MEDIMNKLAEALNISDKTRPQVWAHRGASGYCPENTLPAFLKGFEIDVAAGNTGNDSLEHDGFSGLFFIQRRFRIL